jgi:hypothetical protein
MDSHPVLEFVLADKHLNPVLYRPDTVVSDMMMQMKEADGTNVKE